MKTLLYAVAVLVFLSSAALGADGFSLSVTNSRVGNQRRYVSVDVRVSETFSVTKDNTLVVVVGPIDKRATRPDEFGPPQAFALRGTSHALNRRHFRVEVALPLEKVRVKFMLEDKKKVLYEQSREI